jgi:uncharacterized protein (DUF1697 family)
MKTNKYLALLRGINVGGHNQILMPSLRQALTESGLEQVRTYIQSGNVIFQSTLASLELAQQIEQTIKAQFSLQVPTAVLAEDEFRKIMENAPTTWGQSPDWKYNLIVLLKPYDIAHVLDAIGELQPGLETLHAGEGVLYQAMSKELFGKTTTGKLASKPIYRKMTIRNANTCAKLLELLD